MPVVNTVPQFFTADFAQTLVYFEQQLGFAKQFAYGEPAVYGGVIRDGQSLFIRHVDEPLPWPANKYTEELLDAYVIADDVDALYAEYLGKGVEFHRPLETMPWEFREFVVRDCDGRLLCFGQFVGEGA